MSKKLTLEEFIEKSNKVHQNKYIYTKSDYISCQIKTTITCPMHGDFSQTPLKHMQGQGCPICANEVNRIKHTKNLDLYLGRFKEKHNDKYSYDKSVYKSSKDKITITCPIHGEFSQTIDDHLQGKGCPHCGHIYSKFENEMSLFLSSHNIQFIQHDKKILEGKELDFFIPSKNLGIECNGLRWHSELYGKEKNYHLNKVNKCLDKGINLIHIFEDEWYNTKDIVMSKILHILKEAIYQKKIMGRKCIIKEISYNDALLFLTTNHIQGNCKSSVYIGAFFNEELIGVMSFKREKESIWELTRFATNINYICQGVGGKLFNYFIKKYNPLKIKSFADRRWTLNEKNNLYIKLGFTLEKALSPDYRYYFPLKSKIHRYHKFNFRKERLHKLFKLSTNLTEREMTAQIGAYKIWDCGLYKYIWQKKEND